MTKRKVLKFVGILAAVGFAVLAIVIASLIAMLPGPKAIVRQMSQPSSKSARSTQTSPSKAVDGTVSDGRKR